MVRLDQHDIIVPVSSVERHRRAAICRCSESLDGGTTKRFTPVFGSADMAIDVRAARIIPSWLKKTRFLELPKATSCFADRPPTPISIGREERTSHLAVTAEPRNGQPIRRNTASWRNSLSSICNSICDDTIESKRLLLCALMAKCRQVKLTAHLHYASRRNRASCPWRAPPKVLHFDWPLLGDS